MMTVSHLVLGVQHDEYEMSELLLAAEEEYEFMDCNLSTYVWIADDDVI